MKITSLFCGACLALIPLVAPLHAQDSCPNPSQGAGSEDHNQGAPGGRHHGGPGGGGGPERLAKELNLTQDQQNQLKPVFQEMHAKVKAVRDDSSLSQEQKHAKIKEIRDANKPKIEAVLTPEQKQKFESLKPMHGRGGPGGQGGPEAGE